MEEKEIREKRYRELTDVMKWKTWKERSGSRSNIKVRMKVR